MSTKKLNSIAKRGSMLFFAAGLVAATILPSTVSADALNPLTERSLLLSSSSPGWHNSDGSGNSETQPNAVGTNYAPPGSGPNGSKTGQTFSFKVSTDSLADSRPIRAFTLQYCTTAAGLCKAPGNNTGDTRTTPTADRETNADAHPNKRSDLELVYASAVEGTHFDVFVDGDLDTGWSLATSNREDTSFGGGDAATGEDGLTGKHNYATLSKAAGATPEFNDEIRIVFKATETHYITNPGNNEFFVKINTWDDVSTHNETTNIDGGVTVANVMTNSIHITTKVLETMAFSVGTENRDTQNLTAPAVHGTCDPVASSTNNQLQLGDGNAEYSLQTGKAWDVYSYWRLSSNSSGGASVYYSGNTLANTVGDEIKEIGATAAASTLGTEQFGLAFHDASTDTLSASFQDQMTAQPTRFKTPTLLLAGAADPEDEIWLAPQAAYAGGVGHLGNLVDDGDGNMVAPSGTAATFAFLKSSLLNPVLIANNNQMVISCATAKMRYVANIGADTPAGVYTTKINYLAAPQY